MESARSIKARDTASTPKAVFIAVTAFGFAACVVANWPGHFPPDAIAQLAQGRSGVFNFWHPPIMAWLLGLADRIVPHAPLFFVMDAALFYGALTALALVRGAGWAGVAVVAALCASPLTLIYQGLVVKDVLFADAALAGFAAIAWAARLWARRGLRLALVIIALALFVLATLARQNGAIAGVAGVLTLAFVDLAMRGRAETRSRPGALIRFAVVTLCGLAVVGGACALAESAFSARSDREPETAREWMTLQIYDLAGVVRRDPPTALPILRQRAPTLERFVRGDAVRAFDPTRIDPILKLPGWNRVIKTPSRAVAAQWRQLIAGEPGLYLATRWRVFGQVFATPDVQACAPVLVGVDPGDPEMLRLAGLAARDTVKDDWDGDYATAFLGTPVFSHLAYAAIALVMLVLAGRDLWRGAGGPELIATIGLLIAALSFVASFFVISIACDYRYLYFLDVAAMTALAQRAALWRPAGR